MIPPAGRAAARPCRLHTPRGRAQWCAGPGSYSPAGSAPALPRRFAPAAEPRNPRPGATVRPPPLGAGNARPGVPAVVARTPAAPRWHGRGLAGPRPLPHLPRGRGTTGPGQWMAPRGAPECRGPPEGPPDRPRGRMAPGAPPEGPGAPDGATGPPDRPPRAGGHGWPRQWGQPARMAGIIGPRPRRWWLSDGW